MKQLVRVKLSKNDGLFTATCRELAFEYSEETIDSLTTLLPDRIEELFENRENKKFKVEPLFDGMSNKEGIDKLYFSVSEKPL